MIKCNAIRKNFKIAKICKLKAICHTTLLLVDKLHFRLQNSVALTLNMQPRYLMDLKGKFTLVLDRVKENKS